MRSPRLTTADPEEADVSTPGRPRPEPADESPPQEQGLPASLLESLYSRPSRKRTALVVVPLVAALAAAALVGGSLVWPTGDESEASASDTGVTCWNGDEKVAEEFCTLPRGRAGLEHVFPSFDPQRLTCRDELEAKPDLRRQRSAMWSCDQKIVGPVSITYSRVTGARQTRTYLNRLHGVQAVGDRSSSGVRRQRWRVSQVDGSSDPRLFSGSILLRGAPYAVTVTARRRADVGRALDRRVEVRPLDELRLADPDDLADDD